MNTVVYGILFGLCFYAIETVNACPTAGTINQIAVTTNLSCNSLLFATNGLFNTIVWTNGQNSTLSFNVSSTKVNGESIISFDGTITSGPFNGQSFTASYVLATLDVIACASTDGLTSASGAGVGIIGLNVFNLFSTSNTITWTDGLTNTEKPTLVGGSIVITFTFSSLVDC